MSDAEEAHNRMFDLLLGNDGQAYKEAYRYLEAKAPELYAKLKKAEEAPDDPYTLKLRKALADCRDAFPIPPEGHELENFWAYAMTEPEGIPAYVKAYEQYLLKQIEDKEIEIKKLAEAFSVKFRKGDVDETNSNR